ncbi:MAG: hypothetical protein HJJLKODD_00196 [Phycisphaerae bacterium]|nr:hypothetical protein [Phycisphaerae bacterium]
MANAKIEVVGPGEMDLIANLYSAVFRPPKNTSFFQRRFQGRMGPVMMVAHLDGRPVGFATGFELKPSTYFGWLIGVLPDARRLGVATQLMEALEEWAVDQHYRTMRFECYNNHRAMLHLAIKSGYNILGIRWDPDGNDNLVIFERTLVDHFDEVED